MSEDTPHDDEPSIDIVELFERVNDLEAVSSNRRAEIAAKDERIRVLENKLNSVEERVNTLESDEPAPVERHAPLASFFGFASYAEPAVAELLVGKKPGSIIVYPEIEAYLKRETSCSNEGTIQEYVKDITENGPFEQADVRKWRFTGFPEGLEL